MPASIIYNSSILASLENSSVTLLTAGKQLTDNVVVTDLFSGNTIDDIAMGLATSGSISGSTSYIAPYAFQYTNVTRADFQNVTTIGSSTFYNCGSLSEINFPACTIISANGAFQGCSALTSVNFLSLTSIGSYAFAYCSALTTVSFPKCTCVSGYAFYQCRSLTEVHLPKCSDFYRGAAAFAYCYNLISLPSLSYSTIFNSTPIGGYSSSAGQLGNIYVPTSLVASFKTASYWSLFSDRFIGV